MSREALIREHVEPLAQDLGLTLWGIELAGGSRPVVRIFVEAPAAANTAENGEAGQGVGIEQCAELSRRLGLALEVEDIFLEAWTLEVSSPGFERPFFSLQQLPPYLGREVEVVLAAPVDEWPGRKKFRGLLHSLHDDSVELSLDANQRRADEAPTARLPWSHVRRAHLVHIFEEPEKPGKKKKAPVKKDDEQ